MSNEVKSTIMGIMPIPVGKYLYPLELSHDLFSIVDTLPLVNNLGNFSSKTLKVLDIPEFNSLRSFINFCMQDFLNKVYKPKNNVELYLTDSWINITEKGQYHHPHHHLNSFLSAVFYLNTNSKDTLLIHHSRTELFLIQSSEYNIFNNDVMYLTAEKNSLIVFPSNIRHSVDTINEDRKRISLSVNSFIRGIINDEHRASNLIL